MGKTHTIGESAWSREDYLSELKEFAEIYKNRPVKDNKGGMKAAQLFYAWFVAKKLQPKVIVESGVWYGQGTWVFEQAVPGVELHCIDPVSYYDNGYKSEKAKYYSEDFTKIDWSNIDRENTLCFFDDHQDALQRILACVQWDFKKIMFEDNYPPGQGDCYSLKKAFHESENRFIIPGFKISDYLNHVVKNYLEFPPISKSDKNRWGLPWDHYDIDEQLLGNIIEGYQEIYLEEATNYTWINYVELL